MRIILGDITERQVQYYLNAAMFLEIIDYNRCFTEFGEMLREQNYVNQKIHLAQKIISDRTFGEVYFTEHMLGIRLSKEEIVDIMKKNIVINSQDVFLRRAQTVLKWIEWVNSNDELG